MAQEKALGNLSTIALEGPFSDIDLEDQIVLPKLHAISIWETQRLELMSSNDGPIF